MPMAVISSGHTYALMTTRRFKFDVLLLTRRSLSPTHRMYDTVALWSSIKMSQWGWRSTDSVVRRVNEVLLSSLRRNVHWQCIM